MSWHILKDCENSPCSLEQEEVSSEAISWDGERFAPSSGPTTLAGYCLPDSETESCLDSRFGMMSKHSTETNGEDESMSSQEDFPARTSAQPARALESMGQGPECGSTWPGSFARYDPNSSSWKTPQCSLLEGLDEFSETWPRWGMMRNGACWERTTLEGITNGNGSGLWPTPVKTDGMMPFAVETMKRKELEGVRPSGVKIGTSLRWDRRCLPFLLDGWINPILTEWLMAWPGGWTDLQPLETDKFRRWQQQHSGF